MKKNRVCLFLIFFKGDIKEFYDIMKLILNSYSNNTNTDFYILTDMREKFEKHLSHSNNIFIIDIMYNSFVSKINNLLRVEIDNLYIKKGSYDETTIKRAVACGFRPLIPTLFSEIVDNYDYWGWHDFDVLYGNFDEFVYKYIDSQEVYSIMCHSRYGFLKIFKKCEDIRTLYLDKRCSLYNWTQTQPKLNYDDSSKWINIIASHPDTINNKVGVFFKNKNVDEIFYKDGRIYEHGKEHPFALIDPHALYREEHFSLDEMKHGFKIYKAGWFKIESTNN